MNQGRREESFQNRRRFTRVPYQATVYCVQGPKFGSAAACHDVSRGGMRVTMGHALIPGSLVILVLTNVLDRSTPLEFKARVAQCRPLATGKDFALNFAILQDGPDCHVCLSEVLCDAVFRWGERGAVADSSAVSMGARVCCGAA